MGKAESDEDLIQSARSGDARAFQDLMERHIAFVFAMAYARMRQVEEAEDLTQEVFLRAYLHLDSLARSDRFTSWLRQITRNLATNWQRVQQARSRLAAPVSLDDLPAEPPDLITPGVDETMQRNQEIDAVRRAVFSLPEEQREVVMLHHFEGITQKEIARRLDVHPTTVWRHLRAAHRTLKGRLEAILEDAAPAFHVPKSTRIKTAGVIGAAAVLPSSAKSALAAATSTSAWTASASLGASGGAFAKAAALKSAGASLLTPLLNVLVVVYGAMANIAHTDSPRERKFVFWMTWLCVVLAAVFVAGIQWMAHHAETSGYSSSTARWVAVVAAVVFLVPFGAIVIWATRRQRHIRMSQQNQGTEVSSIPAPREFPLVRCLLYALGGALVPALLGWGLSDFVLLISSMIVGAVLLIQAILGSRHQPERSYRVIARTILLAAVFCVFAVNYRWSLWMATGSRHPTFHHWFEQYGRLGWSAIVAVWYLFLWQRLVWTRKHTRAAD